MAEFGASKALSQQIPLEALVLAADEYVIPGYNGLPLNHYRIRDGKLEFRWIDRRFISSWRTLSTEDIVMHLILKTSVSEWLYARHGFRTGAILERVA